MTNLFKLFTKLMQLVIPGLNLSSVFISLFIKFLFALVMVSGIVGGGLYVKHKYNDYTTTRAQLDKSKQNTQTALAANKELVKDVQTAVQVSVVTSAVVTDNSLAKMDISEKTNKILTDLKVARTEVTIKKQKPVKVVTAKVDTGQDTEEPPDNSVNEAELNITAAWASFCELGGDTDQCAINS